MPTARWTTGFLLIASTAASAAAFDETAFRDQVRPFLVERCVKCHSPAKAKGGVDLTKLAESGDVRKTRKLGRQVIAQLETLEMPPAGEPEPSPELRARVVKLFKQAVNTFDCDDPSQLDPGPPPARRLTRDEYDRTIHDLLGVDVHPAEAVGMPLESPGSGFANLAEALLLPPALMEKYFAAADLVLDRLFAPADGKPSTALNRLIIARPDERLAAPEAARQVLARFLPRAYRRPVKPEEIDRYIALFERAQKANITYDDSIRLLIKATLVSPHFLFRVERDQGRAAAYRVSDHELAVRLSYFLWSAPPDETLRAAADQGQLADPARFDAEVRRMLADPKARALTENFAEPWLQLGKLADARPSTEFFPTFTPRLRQALHDETVAFFEGLRQDNRSVLELLDADYAYLNADLAAHYGVTGSYDDKLRRVPLPGGSHRGGLLGMGSVLAMTSHTSRTSPTLRGKWILEVLFGTPPPPPPANAGKLNEEPPKGGEPPKTFREQMARHARQPECAACHARIDPLGYGLENFDAIGRWRVELGGRPLDTSGQLPGGASFTGPDELRSLLKARRGDFERNLVERMLVYALGREIQGDDECAVRRILADLERDGHRFSTLVLAITRSAPFQYRRDPAPRD
jgi:hypothetical protein